jgi:hypothetical protein
VADEESTALHGELELLEPGARFVTASLTPDEGAFLRILEDRRDRSQGEIELRSETRVVSELVGVVTVLDGTENPAEVDVASR